MDIRPAHAGDIPQLLGLIRRYWDFEGLEGFSALRIELVLKELLAPPAAGGAIWVAHEQGSLVAYLTVVLMLSIEHQGLMAEIDEFFVLPEARSRGTGARLLAVAEADLARRNCLRLQLQLRSGNARARSFYERLGFVARAGYELLDKPLG
jgi:GNAT superfamily N-acetyltransferase